MPDEVNQPPEVGPQDAHALLDEGAYLLDVREPDEWAAGHADEATHIPLGELEHRYGEVPLDRTIVCVCRGGVRSAQAAAALANLGYDTVNLAGGMRAWAGAQLPLVDASGAPGTVI